MCSVCWQSAVAVVLGAGAATGLAAPGDRPRVPVAWTGHMYVDVATGEASFVPPVAGALSPTQVFVAGQGAACPDTSGGFFLADDPTDVFGFGAFQGSVFADWADVAPDTLVDGVSFELASWIPDEPGAGFDTDGDTVPDVFIGDGVEGFGVVIAFYDGDDGGQSTRAALAAYTITGLPGDPNNFSATGGVLSIVLTLDLEDVDGTGTTSTFEIGDSDGVSDADHVNLGIFNDPVLGDAALDGNGLADFGYAFNYIQPGTRDLDGDGTIDGDPGDAAPTFFDLATPRGQVVFDGAGQRWEIVPDDALQASMTDALAILPGSSGVDASQLASQPLPILADAPFSCLGPDLDGDTEPDFFPNAYDQLPMLLLGRVPSACPADIVPDGLLDFFDVSAFLGDFNGACTPGIGDFDSDGACDFFDVSAFLASFAAGC